MERFIAKLVTDATPIIKLKDNNINEEEKYDVLGITIDKFSSASRYINNMYYKDGKWYYFKEDYNYDGYPFGIIDELMGMYLSKLIGLPTVDYQISKYKRDYGVSSINFRTDDKDYMFLLEFKIEDWVADKLMAGDTKSFIKGEPLTFSYLKTICKEKNNLNYLIEQILKLTALDFYMLQKDRCGINVQFEKDKKTNFISLAPLYDFSSCIPKIDDLSTYSMRYSLIHINRLNTEMFLREHPEYKKYFLYRGLNYFGLTNLLKYYPEFEKYLTFFLDHKMSDVWSQICDDFHFNQDKNVYARILKYYKLKEESQRKNIDELLNGVQKIKKVI